LYKVDGGTGKLTQLAKYGLPDPGAKIVGNGVIDANGTLWAQASFGTSKQVVLKFPKDGKAPSVVYDSTADKQGLLLAYQNTATGLVQVP
jgi:hypothetical protein